MLLKEDTISVGKITEEPDIYKKIASNHMKKMHNCGITEKERDGKKIIYIIASDSINDLVEDVSDVCGEVR